MTVTTEMATVYRGGGRRWFSLKAACNAEAAATMKKKDKPRCECSSPQYDTRSMGWIDGGMTCDLHEPDRYQKRHRRLARLIHAAATEQHRTSAG